MEKFKKIVSLDDTGMNETCKKKLYDLGEEVLFFEGIPNDEEAIRRIGDADCVLVSISSSISRKVIEACPNIKYIGLNCSLFRYNPKSCKVDIAACDDHGIELTGIFHYGDNGVREFIVAAVSMLMHGHQKYMWADYPHEMAGRKFGVIGFGVVGRMVCDAMKYFDADVYYTDLKPANDDAKTGFKYLPKEELLKTVDILSIHVPRGNVAMSDAEFELFGDHKVLVNCSYGITFDVPAMKKWLARCEKNFFIADKDGSGEYWEEFKALPQTIIGNYSAGASYELTDRRSDKMIENMVKFLKEH